MIPARFIQQIAPSIQRLVGFLIVASCYLVIAFFTPVHAQTNPYAVPNTNPDVPQNLHTGVQGVMIEVMSAMVCQLAGIDPVKQDQKCLGIDQKTGAIGFVENGGGAIGVINHAIAILFNPPIRTSTYISYVSERFGITQPAYAQGTGFEGLKPLINLWGAFRNIAYLGFILVFVLIGLAIMLRVKIDPRTVMTVQNQIPRIIIGLLLVTFSFAIAGFLIDLMYVAMYTSYSVISNSGAIPASNFTGLNPTLLQGQTVFTASDALNNNFTGTVGVVARITSDILPMIQSILGLGLLDISPLNFLIHLASGVAGYIAGTNFGQWVNTAVANENIAGALNLIPGEGLIEAIADLAISVPAGIIAGALAAITTELALRILLPWLIVYLIILVAVLFAMFRLWFTLIKAYIFFLIEVVLAPLWITFGLVPGNEAINFGSWLRDMIANISAFPVTLVLFLLGKVFIDAFDASWNPGAPSPTGLFVPPLIGNPNGGSASPIGAIIGLGIILMTPQVVNIIKDLIKSPQLKYTAAIGQGLGAGVAPISRGITGVGSLGFGVHYEADPDRPGSQRLVGRGRAIGRVLRGFGFVR